MVASLRANALQGYGTAVRHACPAPISLSDNPGRRPRCDRPRGDGVAMAMAGTEPCKWPERTDTDKVLVVQCAVCPLA